MGALAARALPRGGARPGGLPPARRAAVERSRQADRWRGPAGQVFMSTLHYDRLARYYDLIYATKDYRSEVADQIRLIEKYQRSPGRELLEVACGTGRYLEHFEKRFRCTGLDLNPPMLRIARQRLARSRLVVGDMSTFDLGVEFDVVACLFGAIGYVHGSRNLKRAVRNFSDHLKPGGV